MKNFKKASSGRKNMCNHRLVETRKMLLGFVVTVLLLPIMGTLPGSAQTYNAGDKKEFKVSTNLHSNFDRGWDVAQWEFEANRYGQVKIKLSGHWRVMWFNTPSQHFRVSVNGKEIYKGDLVGDKTVNYILDSLE